MSSLIIVKDQELLIGSFDLAKGMNVEHRAVKNLLKKYKNEFEELGLITSEMQKVGRKKVMGRPVEEELLNEAQATYLTTLLQNNEKVRKFKMHLTKEFFRQRKILNKLLIQKNSEEWKQKRADGKIERREETDEIKKFVEYAKSQGSKSADRYYMALSKMEKESLFALELMQQRYDNFREMVDSFSLDSLKMADYMVKVALRKGMEGKIPYKEIYVMAKDRVESFAVSLGKTPMRMMLEERRLQLK
jgi:hypothetical protein